MRDDAAAAFTSLRWLCEIETHVTVIHDGAGPEVADMLRQAGSGYDVLSNPVPLGLAASVAKAAAGATEQYVAVLSAGLVPAPQWLDNLVSAMQRYSPAAVASSLYGADAVSREDVRYCAQAARLPIAGSLIERSVAAGLKPGQTTLDETAGPLLFQPAAALIDLGRIQIDAKIVFNEPGPCVLFIDAHAPYYDREGGGHRLWHLLRIARNGGWRVLFVPMDGMLPEPYLSQLRQAGVDVYDPRLNEAVEVFIRRRASEIAVAWLSRPEVAETCAPVLRAANSAAAIVYDTVDLHYVRLQRRAAALNRAEDWQSMRERELALSREADAVVVVSAEEKDVLESAGIAPVFIVPTVHEAVDSRETDPDERAGVLFMGSYDHEPNVDAARRLAEGIMPMVRARLPGTKLTLLGNNPPPQVRALRSDAVLVPGYVVSVKPFFERARVFAAPLRYGAGMKAKITQALAFGVPIVTTDVGGEGVTRRGALILADTDEEFAAAIVRLHRDGEEWRRMRAEGRAAAEAYEPERVSGDVLTILERCRLLSFELSNADKSTLPVTPR